MCRDIPYKYGLLLHLIWYIPTYSKVNIGILMLSGKKTRVIKKLNKK